MYLDSKSWIVLRKFFQSISKTKLATLIETETPVLLNLSNFSYILGIHSQTQINVLNVNVLRYSRHFNFSPQILYISNLYIRRLQFSMRTGALCRHAAVSDHLPESCPELPRHGAVQDKVDSAI